MFKFRIITDSSCGISQEEAKDLGVVVLPLNIQFDGKNYLDGVDITTNELYEKIFNKKGEKEIPKTSLITPATFLDVYKKVIAEGFVPVVLPIASVLSGTYNSACVAKEMLEGEEIYVVDSKSALGSVKIMIEHIVATEYETAKDLLKDIEYMKAHLNFYSVPDNLEYLVANGRLSKTKGLLGKILQIKPVIQLDKDGVLTPIATIRGLKRAFHQIAEYLKEFPIDFKYPFFYGYSTVVENVNNLIEITKEFVNRICKPQQISPAVGAHVGPGASAIFYISTKVVKK